MMRLVPQVAPTPPRFRFTPKRIARTLDRTKSAALWDEIAEHTRPQGIVQFRFGAQRAWVLNDPTWARQAFTAPYDVIARSETFTRIRIFLGDSLLTTDGPPHRLRRRQVQPAFHRPRLESYADSIVAAAQVTAQSWEPGQQVAMEREMAALTMDAIGRAVLGVDGRALAPAVGKSLDQLMRAVPLLFIPKFERIALKPLPGLSWLREAQRSLDRIARESAERSDAELVRSLREAVADVPELEDDEVRDELLTLLLAGHETTATTLAWAWWLLDRHPDVADRMRAEICSVLGDRTPSYDDVDKLPFTQAVVAETLRLRPAAWIVERVVVGKTSFGPYQAPPGTLLLILPWLLHRDPRVWPEAEQFRPQRWITPDGHYAESAPGQPRGAYLPFGAGAHVCIGASFAWIEAVLALAVLAAKWRPTLVPGAEVGLRAAVTMRPEPTMPMRLEKAL